MPRPTPDNPFGRTRFNRPLTPEAKSAFDVEKELDAVIGRFEEPRDKSLQRYGRLAGRVLLGACLAVAAATAVVYVLHSQVRQAQTAPAPPRPVIVDIVPSR